MITETRSLDGYKEYEIGEGTYGQPEILWPQAHLHIGKYCSISTNVKIYLGGEHNVNWATTYPLHTLFGEINPKHPATKGDVWIGNDVWIGEGVTILSGVRIGDGAVIGAHSVVRHWIEPYMIVRGNPARVTKYRIRPDLATRLMGLSWWDWSRSKIEENKELLSRKLDEETISLLEEVAQR